jgi:S-adenosylmethionine:tRNA ribosyltransferase-isomerase
LVKTSDFSYHLPPELIAQTPVEPRDQAWLMVLDRSDGWLEHRRFYEIAGYLREGDVLVFNNSRVIPARLIGRKADSGGRLELLLLRRLGDSTWEALVRPARRTRVGSRLELLGNPVADGGQEVRVTAEVIELRDRGRRVMRFSDETRLLSLGSVPLPPYIRTPLEDPERYQTVYADVSGSVAAPTAGLHFTPGLISELEGRGVSCLFITLHVGLDTFLPVREENPLEHPIHREFGVISREVAGALSRAKREKRRVICVGTTTVRLLEAAAQASSPLDLPPFEDWVSLFILPGYRFQMVDALITNFHLPCSTLLMLVTAFAGRDVISRAYQEAIAHQYRFYSFGDAMLIL